jgi:tripartite ATP-independent transporter DctM subunit
MTFMLPELLSLGLFAVSIGVLMLGFPVAFSLAGTALAFALIGHLVDAFDLRLLGGLPSRVFGILTNEVLVAVPLFIFMGIVLERSQIGERLLSTLGRALGRLRGGMAYAVTLVGALLAATTGIVGATVITMGLISLPAMLRAGYDVRFACGVVCASGTLGQIIPPSIALVILGDVLQGANAQAQLALGNFAPEPVSVVDLFAGALLPGLVLVGIYLVYQAFTAALRPSICPPALLGERPPLGEILSSLLAPIALIVAVLGSVLFGFATPTESAAVGSVGTLILAGLHGRLTRTMLTQVVHGTLRMTSMIFVIIIGASVFALVFRGLDGERLVVDALHAMPGGPTGAMLAVMALMFALGFFLDFVEIVVVVVPIVGPALLMLGIDPLWLGVMIAINLQTSFLTPPFGPALFYLRSVAPDTVRTIDIYRGVGPFVLLQLLGLAVVWFLPGLATWLPARIFS